MLVHVFVVPTHNGCTDLPIHIGVVDSVETAYELVAAKGYEIIPEINGGNTDMYDADDAPGIYNYDYDGHGAIDFSVKA